MTIGNTYSLTYAALWRFLCICRMGSTLQTNARIELKYSLTVPWSNPKQRPIFLSARSLKNQYFRKTSKIIILNIYFVKFKEPHHGYRCGCQSVEVSVAETKYVSQFCHLLFESLQCILFQLLSWRSIARVSEVTHVMIQCEQEKPAD